MISNLRQIIHVHIPKTGGTWLNKTLRSVSPRYTSYLIDGHLSIGAAIASEEILRHKPAKDVINNHNTQLILASVESPEFPNRWDEAVKISICRNPFDLLTSYYFHDWEASHQPSPRSVKLEGGPRGWDNINTIHGIRDFDGFIKRYCDPDFKWWHSYRKKHLFYQMFTPEGPCGVDIIIRQERLFAGTKVFLTENGYCTQEDIIKQRPYTNVSNQKKKDYRSYYTDELRELVTEWCFNELKDFHYNFDGPTDNNTFIDAGPLNWK